MDGEPVKDFIDYLNKKHNVGEEGLANIDAGKRAILVMKVLSSFKDMLKYAQSKKLGNVMGFLNNTLLKVTKFLSPLVTLFVKTLFDRDPLVRKVFRYLLAGIGIWGAANIAVFILGRVLNIGWMSISWPLAGLSLAAVAVLLIFAYLSRKFPVKDRPTLEHDSVLWEAGGRDGLGRIRVSDPLCPKDYTPLAIKHHDRVDTKITYDILISDSHDHAKLICPECQTEYTLNKNPKKLADSSGEVRNRFEGMIRRERESHGS